MENKYLEMLIDQDNIPKHIALIMDGNGRWAKKRFMPVSFGHTKGVDRVEDAIELAQEIGCEVISFYAFSTENWKRDKDEIDHLFKLLHKFYKKKFPKLVANKIRFKFIGSIVGVPDDIIELFAKMEKETEMFDGLVVNLAFNYGGRLEIVEAVNKLLKDGVKEITEQDIADNLYTAGQNDVDLLIRTSGEMRLSNFLIWQNAYSEFVFMDELWPDFNKKIFINAINKFQKRNRRFGGR